MDDLITWLRAVWHARLAKLDDEDRIARAAINQGGIGRTGEAHWARAHAGREALIGDRAGNVIVQGIDPAWGPSSFQADHIVRQDPARTLERIEVERRQIEAGQKILDAWRPEGANPHPGVPCENWPGQGGENYDPYDSCAHHLAAPPRTPDHVVQLLAQPYAGRAGWREEWGA